MDPIHPPPSSMLRQLAAFEKAKLAARHDFFTARSVDPVVVNDFLYGPFCGDSADRPRDVVLWANSIKGRSAGDAFWIVLLEQWPSFDRIDHRDLARLFAKFSKQWRGNNEISRLPDEMVVFRGQSAHAPIGLAWTLSRSVAEQFSNGHRGITVRSPTVLETKIRRESVVMVFYESRNETELVLWTPPRTSVLIYPDA